MSEPAVPPPPPPSSPVPGPPASERLRHGPPPVVAAALAWLFPGLGHFLLGRRGSAALYAVIVTVTFLLGLSFEGRLYSPEPGQPLTILATFAVYGAGLLNLAARLLSSNPSGTILSVTYEYGCAFLLTAGLMNLLLMLDTYDIAVGRKP